MNNRFDLMIRKMENELTALKTAHERGLGAVDFYSKSASGSGSYSFGIVYATITATVASGELVPAFCQPQISIPNAFFITLDRFSQSGNTITWTYSGQYSSEEGTATASAKIISASKLASLTVVVS